MLRKHNYGRFIAENYLIYTKSNRDEYKELLDKGEIPYGDLNADWTTTLKPFNDDVAVSLPDKPVCETACADLAKVISESCLFDDNNQAPCFNYDLCLKILRVAYHNDYEGDK